MNLLLKTTAFILISFLTSCTAPPPANQTTDSIPPNTLTDAEIQAGWQLLFDGKTTDGWHTYGKETATGWEVKNGELIALGKGGDIGGDIVSDEQFSDVEWSLEWKLSPEGNSGLFYHVQEDTSQYGAVYYTGPEYQLIDDDHFPEPLQDWQKTGANYAMHLATSRPTNPIGEWNHSRILVDGGHVEHWLNGTKIVDFEAWTPEWQQRKDTSKWKDYPDYGRFRAGRLALQDHGNQIWFRSIKGRRLGRSLFNGVDLTGWEVYGTEKWYVNAGELICESGPDSAYGYLATVDSFKNFELELEFLQEANGNSGVFFRSSIEGTKITGWQAEVAPAGDGNGTGGIYESYGRGWLAEVSAEKELAILRMGQWNHMKIRVVGDDVTTWLNGHEMIHLSDAKIGAANGQIALQIHDGGGIKVRWRNIYVRRL